MARLNKHNRLALGANQDSVLIKETFDYILNKSRDQDIMYYFRGLQLNFKARRALGDFFKANYETVRCWASNMPL